MIDRRHIAPTQDVARKIAASHARFNIDITQRPAKSTASIIAKLRREHARLTQIQDIGGLRLVVSKTSVQNKALALVLSLYPQARVIDRRLHDTQGNPIKYGGGSKETKQHLKMLSDGVQNIENFEQRADTDQREIAVLRNQQKAGKRLTKTETLKIVAHEELRRKVRIVRQGWLKYFKEATEK